MRAPIRLLLFVSGLILLAVDLSSCASSAKYSAKVHSWEGKSEQSLVTAWGQPDAIEPIHSGNRMFVYARLKRYPVAYWETPGFFASAPTRHPSEYSETLYIKCSTFFEVDKKHVIQTVLFRGEECTSLE